MCAAQYSTPLHTIPHHIALEFELHLCSFTAPWRNAWQPCSSSGSSRGIFVTLLEVFWLLFNVPQFQSCACTCRTLLQVLLYHSLVSAYVTEASCVSLPSVMCHYHVLHTHEGQHTFCTHQ